MQMGWIKDQEQHEVKQVHMIPGFHITLIFLYSVSSYSHKYGVSVAMWYKVFKNILS